MLRPNDTHLWCHNASFHELVRPGRHILDIFKYRFAYSITFSVKDFEMLCQLNETNNNDKMIANKETSVQITKHKFKIKHSKRGPHVWERHKTQKTFYNFKTRMITHKSKPWMYFRREGLIAWIAKDVVIPITYAQISRWNRNPEVWQTQFVVHVYTWAFSV